MQIPLLDLKNPRISPCIYALMALLTISALWFLPITYNLCKWLDYQSFTFLNKSLVGRQTWQQFWGLLNHPNENWINLVVMVSINFTGIYLLSPNKRKCGLGYVLYYWAIFQIGMLVSHAIFGHSFLDINRESPTYVIQPFVLLNEALNNPDIKIMSASSFPAGHAFVLIYWLFFTKNYVTGILKFVTYFVAILLLFPRMISGAHWLTDIVFTIFFAYFWYTIAALFQPKKTAINSRN